MAEMLSKPTVKAGGAVFLLMLAVAAAATLLGRPLPALGASVVLFAMLTALSIWDLETGLLPNWLTLPLIGLGGLQAWLVSGDLLAALLGAVIGYGLIWALSVYWRRVRGVDGVGLGDAKLLAAGGAWTGWIGLPFILLIASGAALIVASITPGKLTAKRSVRFGPFLALGIWSVWCFAPVSA